jgi:hypothetical protein
MVVMNVMRSNGRLRCARRGANAACAKLTVLSGSFAQNVEAKLVIRAVIQNGSTLSGQRNFQMSTVRDCCVLIARLLCFVLPI